MRRGGRLSVYQAARTWYSAHGAGRFDLLIDEVNTRPFGCARWAAGTPTVALVHQVAREIWSCEFPPPLSWAGRYLAEPHWLRSLRGTPVLTVSASSRESLREHGIRDSRLVPEGISRRPRPAVPREPRPTVMFLGRLAPSSRSTTSSKPSGNCAASCRPRTCGSSGTGRSARGWSGPRHLG